jgi:hypothetical protein
LSKLIAQNNDQVTHLLRFLRQASEQYFTSSHTLAHFLRQTDGRAQIAQVICGSKVLSLAWRIGIIQTMPIMRN